MGTQGRQLQWTIRIGPDRIDDLAPCPNSTRSIRFTIEY